MDPIIDRFGRLIRSYLQDDDDTTMRTGDQDLSDAWSELNSFLNDEEAFDAALHGNKTKESNFATGGGSSSTFFSGSRQSNTPPEDLRQDYANLEVPFGASPQKVREEYKRLMREYHPDKYGGDTEKMRIATEIAQKINVSYQRIRTFESTGKVD